MAGEAHDDSARVHHELSEAQHGLSTCSAQEADALLIDRNGKTRYYHV